MLSFSKLGVLGIALVCCIACSKGPKSASAEKEPGASAPIFSGEVSIESDVGRDVGLCTIPGTLLVPTDALAVVVMIHGSGKNDRDQSLPQTGEAPFRDIAEGLAKRGIASLRYDKRNVIPGCSEKVASSVEFSPFDFMADATRVAEFTRHHPLTAELPLIMLGHSQGVNFAVEIADPVGASGVVLMAGLSVNSIDETYLRQVKSNAENEALDPEVRKQLQGHHQTGVEFFARVRTGEVRPDEYFNVYSSGFWRDWILITERAEAKVAALKVPGLVIQGTIDWNVTREDFDRIAELFPVAGSRSYLAEGLHHGFCRAGENRVPQEVFDQIASWIKSVVPAR